VALGPNEGSAGLNTAGRDCVGVTTGGLTVVLARGPVGVGVGAPVGDGAELPVGDGAELPVGADGELSGTDGVRRGGFPPGSELPTGGRGLGADGDDVVGVEGRPVSEGGCGGLGRSDDGGTDSGFGEVALVVGTEGVVVDDELGVVVDGRSRAGQGRLTRPGWSYQR
jgi:hypothetical protein